MKNFAIIAATVVLAIAGNVQALTFTQTISDPANDQERRVNAGTPEVDPGSSDLELGKDNSRPNTVALRFTGVTIPAGATITNATVQFAGDGDTDNASDSSVADADFVIHGEKVLDAAALSVTDPADIAGRPRTTATVNWDDVPAWTASTKNAASLTPNLAPIVAEIIGQAGWTSGNSIVILVEESSLAERTAMSTERAATDGPALAPTLTIDYTVAGPTSADDEWSMYN